MGKRMMTANEISRESEQGKRCGMMLCLRTPETKGHTITKCPHCRFHYCEECLPEHLRVTHGLATT